MNKNNTENLWLWANLEAKQNKQFLFHYSGTRRTFGIDWGGNYSQSLRVNLDSPDHIQAPIQEVIEALKYRGILHRVPQEYLKLKQNVSMVKITKTEKVTVNKKKRDITITVLVDHSGNVRAGYSVRCPGDKHSDELANRISEGRALSDKTNLITDMVCGIGMDKKYILYAIAENLFRRIERGQIEIKGVK